MRLDRIAITLRMREPWEAIDLGVVMVRSWWRPVYGTWMAVVLPLLAIVNVLLATSPLLALVAMWWLKPVYDRVVLHVLSQAVFGSTPSLRETLADLGGVMRSSGLFAALTWRRLDPIRSFHMAVRQLERQTGAAARARERLLGRRAAGQATGLLYACLTFEFVLMLSLGLCLDLLTPAGIAPASRADGFLDALAGFGDAHWDAYLRNAFYVVTMTLVEPLFVASGFSLYLNRRTALEAWDLELAFRRMQTSTAPSSRSTALCIAGAILAIGIPHAQPPAAAATSTADSKQIIREVLSAPDFREYEEKLVWRSRNPSTEKQDQAQRRPFFEFFLGLADTLSVLTRWTAYALVAAVLTLLVVYLVRAAKNAPFGHLRANPKPPPPDTLFGFDIRLDSLPDDLAGLAARAASDDPRMALSLLYRGALATLIHRDGLRIESGDTEGDCLQRVRSNRPGDLAEYFRQLVAAWSTVAYAKRAVEVRQVLSLCAEWPKFFGPPIRDGV